tara:strand:+ start:1850 stop:2287 length:438 start_codon:yes stop_codon:yes gene_type:complete
MRIPIDDPNAVKKHIDDLIKERVAIAPEVVDLVFDDMADEMQTRAKIHLTNNMSVLTGLLRSSITVDREYLRKEIGTNVEYAPHVEYGTAPHMINSSVLIKTPDDAKGKWVYIKEHKGSRPYPYMRPAFNEVKNRFNDYVLPYFE